MELNPYAAPLAAPGAPPPLSEVDQIRKDHIGHEASVKSLGQLYFLAGLGIAMGLVIAGFAVFSVEDPLTVLQAVAMVAGLAFCVLFFWLAGGIRRLRPWARMPAAILAAIGLLIIPVGTIINAYVLYLLLSTKGSMVFSERYQEIIVVTPHIRYKTSPVIYALLGLVILGIVAAACFAMFR